MRTAVTQVEQATPSRAQKNLPLLQILLTATYCDAVSASGFSTNAKSTRGSAVDDLSHADMMHIEMRLNGSRSPHCHLRHSSELCRNDEIRRSGEVAIPQLYAKLKSPIIEGTMEED